VNKPNIIITADTCHIDITNKQFHFHHLWNLKPTQIQILEYVNHISFINMRPLKHESSNISWLLLSSIWWIMDTNVMLYSEKQYDYISVALYVCIALYICKFYVTICKSIILHAVLCISDGSYTNLYIIGIYIVALNFIVFFCFSSCALFVIVV